MPEDEIETYIQKSREEAERLNSGVKDFAVFDLNHIPEKPLIREEVKKIVDVFVRYHQTGIPRHLLIAGARVSYSLNGARGNTAMESFNGHFKGENESIFWEQKDIRGVIRVVETRMRYYNGIRRHESLGQISPNNFLIKHGIKAQ